MATSRTQIEPLSGKLQMAANASCLVFDSYRLVLLLRMFSLYLIFSLQGGVRVPAFIYSKLLPEATKVLANCFIFVFNA